MKLISQKNEAISRTRTSAFIRAPGWVVVHGTRSLSLGKIIYSELPQVVVFLPTFWFYPGNEESRQTLEYYKFKVIYCTGLQKSIASN